jgi:hypothetical protein
MVRCRIWEDKSGGRDVYPSLDAVLESLVHWGFGQDGGIYGFPWR